VDPGTGWDREFGPVEDFGAKDRTNGMH
jgi:hypothetical protein